MAAASGDNDALDGSLARQAGLVLASVDAMLKLKKTRVSGGIHVVGNRRSAGGDRLCQHLLDCVVEARQFGSRERSGAAARTDAGAEQRFIGIDVANPA